MATPARQPDPLGPPLLLAAALALAGCAGPRQPQSVDPAALAACNVGDTLLRKLPGLTQLRPAPVAFDSIWPDSAGRIACRLSALGHLPQVYGPTDSILAWLTLRGWSEQTRISADGTDGTVVGVAYRGATCVLRGFWDGGDASDTSYVPSDTVAVHFSCTRTIASDTTLP